MPTKEARLRAQKKYDETHKDNFKSYHIKFNRVDDVDIIKCLENQPNKNGFIKELIRKYISEK